MVRAVADGTHRRAKKRSGGTVLLHYLRCFRILYEALRDGPASCEFQHVSLERMIHWVESSLAAVPQIGQTTDSVEWLRLMGSKRRNGRTLRNSCIRSQSFERAISRFTETTTSRGAGLRFPPQNWLFHSSRNWRSIGTSRSMSPDSDGSPYILSPGDFLRLLTPSSISGKCGSAERDRYWHRTSLELNDIICVSKSTRISI